MARPWNRIGNPHPPATAIFAGIGVNTVITAMSLLPRWRYMTDEAKTLARRTAVSGAVLLVALLLLRPLLPLVILAVIGFWIWKSVQR